MMLRLGASAILGIAGQMFLMAEERTARGSDQMARACVQRTARARVDEDEARV